MSVLYSKSCNHKFIPTPGEAFVVHPSLELMKQPFLFVFCTLQNLMNLHSYQIIAGHFRGKKLVTQPAILNSMLFHCRSSFSAAIAKPSCANFKSHTPNFNALLIWDSNYCSCSWVLCTFELHLFITRRTILMAGWRASLVFLSDHI